MNAVRLGIIVVLLVAAAVMGVLSIVTWKKRAMAGQAAVYLCLGMVAAAIYDIGYAMELSSDTLEDAMVWVRFQHFGIEWLAPAWLLFALCVTGNERVITLRRVAALMAVPTLLFLAAQTLGSFNLLHHNPRMVTSGLFPMFTYDRTIFNWVAIVYYSLCTIVSTVLFIGVLVLRTPFLRTQATIYLLASLVPWSVSVPYNLGLTFYNLDLTPLSFSLAGALFAWGYLRFHLLDIVPLARDSVVESMPDGVLVLDRAGRIVDFNRRLCEILPDMAKGCIGRAPASALAAYPDLVHLIEDGTSESADMTVAGSPRDRYYHVRLVSLLDKHGQSLGRIMMIHDSTEMRQLLQKMERLATVDDLTGVYNRRRFMERLGEEMYRVQRYGGALSLIMLDIDHFKDINDTYGHAAGDAALRMAADICRGIVRQSDVLGRLGGDEFVILLPETDTERATVCAERLRGTLEQSVVHHEGQSFTVTASLGVTGVVFPTSATVEDVLRWADMALYKAKEEGRNRVRCIACADPQAVAAGVAGGWGAGSL